MADYRKLDVWRKSHALALEVYGVNMSPAAASGAFACELRTAARIIPRRIVQACSEARADDFARVMHDAEASVDGLCYLLLFARDAGELGAVQYAKLEARANQLRAMLGGFNRTVNRKLAARPAATGRAGRVAQPAARGAQGSGSSRR